MNTHVMANRRCLGTALLAAALVLVFAGCSKEPASKPEAAQPQPKLVKIRYGTSPYQDSLLPVLGGDKYTGWYREEGLDVEFRVLALDEAREGLAAKQFDVIWNNMGAVVSTHAKNPELVYWYGINAFDNGFAIMIRPDGKMKTAKQLEKEFGDHTKAVAEAARQLKGKVVVTTGRSDFEQGVAAAARRGGLRYSKDDTSDVKIIDLPPDEGLAAFLSGQGDAYLGGIPQRTRCGKEGMLELLSGPEIGLSVINGIVTTKSFDEKNRAALLKLLKVWFRIVNSVQSDQDKYGKIIADQLNQYTAAKFTVEDFKKFWQNYEHFPLSPSEAEKDILSSTGSNYWKNQWDEANEFFYGVIHVIPKPLEADGVFLMPQVQQGFVRQFGAQPTR